MLQTNMSTNKSTSLLSTEDTCSTVCPNTPITTTLDLYTLNPLVIPNPHDHQQKPKKKRNLPGNPDPEAEVIALSPRTLMATNRFVCEICNKGFQRDQNLQLHRRGHNLPWKLRHRNSSSNSNKEVLVKKRVYVCPEPNCVHNHPSRALGDLTGIKKHFCRKHGEKIWRCDKCSKKYAVMSDWKAHAKTCGTREYRCDCGTLFTRKDSFLTHRAFCDALAEESARLAAAAACAGTITSLNCSSTPNPVPFTNWADVDQNPNPYSRKMENNSNHSTILLHDHNPSPSSQLSATALLQKASVMGCMAAPAAGISFNVGGAGGAGEVVDLQTWKEFDEMGGRLSTRDFLGNVTAGSPGDGVAEELLLSGLALDLVSSSSASSSRPPM